MRIACPQCSMAYSLDEQLLPPGGAPVQCTRCNHVFTAYPPGHGGEEAEAGAGGPGAGGRTSTTPFGVEAPPGRAGTQLFGAASAEQAQVRKSTQVFGTVSGEVPPARASTQMFGAVTDAAAPGAVPARTSTQPFGAVTDAAAPGTVPSRASTQMFGAAAPSAATGPAEAPAVGASPTPKRAGTQLFGAVEAPPPEGAAPKRAGTQLFGAAEAPRPGDAAPRTVPQASGAAAELPGTATERAERARPRVELPVEPELLSVRAEREARERPASTGTGGALGGRRAVLWVGGVLAAAVLGLGAWKALAPRQYEASAEAQLAWADAARLVRRDDAASRERALSQLEALATSEPGFIEARADLAVALALELDDVKLSLREGRASGAGLAEQVAELERAQVPSDWQNRVNALREELAEVERRTAPLEARAGELERRLEAAVASLAPVDGELTPAQSQAVVRAQAVAHAVRGSAQVLELTERYRQQGATDGWGDVAYAEYVVNAPAGRAGLERARETLGALKGQDASFVRLFVLEARLALLAGEPQTARAHLESALTLNPDHQLARQLLARLEESGQADGG